MRSTDMTPRRGFLARALAGAAAAGWSTMTLRASTAVEQAGASDGWLKEVPGKSRCFFDCPQHMNGFGLVHILNYLAAYPAGQAGVASSFYGVGPASSIALGFNDAMWAKYGLGEILGLKDASGKPYTRNVFVSPAKADGHLLAQRTQIPSSIGMLGDALVGSSIPSLQKMGTKFILCNNALGLWTLELEARGKGTAAAIDKELRANLVPGVTIVPAMVQAIEQAQAAGLSYNRQ
jgi:intracellular sulfur oxidation DsrE/DsrF family protein